MRIAVVLFTIKIVFCDPIEESRRIIEQLKEERNIPGLVIGVAHNGRNWIEGFGFCDLENRIPCRPESQLRIGSISKSIVASFVGQLTQNRINFDDDIHQFLSKHVFPDKFWDGHLVNLTIRQLLSHTGGIRINSIEELNEIRHFSSNRESISIVANDSLLFQPGTNWTYSNWGYELIGSIIESVFNDSSNYEQLIDQFLCEFLQLNKTLIDKQWAIQANRTRYYVNRAIPPLTFHNGTQNAPLQDTVLITNHKTAGGLMSTVGDLIQFATIMLDSYRGMPHGEFIRIGIN